MAGSHTTELKSTRNMLSIRSHLESFVDSRDAQGFAECGGTFRTGRLVGHRDSSAASCLAIIEVSQALAALHLTRISEPSRKFHRL